MVYCPQDPNAPQLYVVKREFAEEYESGHNSSIGPKLYLIGNAKTVCKKNNYYYNAIKKQTVKRYWDNYFAAPVWAANYPASEIEKLKIEYTAAGEKELEKGPWIIAPAVVSIVM